MAITTWTSEGMVWTLPNLQSAPMEYKWIEAIRLACYERLQAIYGSNPSANFLTLHPGIDTPITSGDLPRYGSGGSSPYIGTVIERAIADIYFNHIKHTIGDPNGQRYCPVWTQADLLTAIGTGTWYTIANSHPFRADYLWQCYNVLNLCLWVRHRANIGGAADMTLLSEESRQSRLSGTDAASGWAASSWTTTTSGNAVARALRQSRLPGQYDLGHRSRSQVRCQYIDTSRTYDWQYLINVSTSSSPAATYDAQGTGYVDAAWNTLSTGTGSTAANHDLSIGYDDTLPPNSPPAILSYIGWEATSKLTAHAADGDALGTVSGSVRGAHILIRKYNVTGGYAFVP